MTKSDILKKLEPMDDDKVIVFVGSDGGWSNLGPITETEGSIELRADDGPVFEN